MKTVALVAALLISAQAYCETSDRVHPDQSIAIRHVELDANSAVYVPVHPRIATTIRFPRAIGEPMGTSFLDADEVHKAGGKQIEGEYMITFAQGDQFFTVQPLQKAQLLNLNVPYEGATIVLYFYVAPSPLEAVASLIFEEKGSSSSNRKNPSVAGSENSPPEVAPRISRSTEPPKPEFVPSTPVRVEGLLDKLRIIHAAHTGDELNDVAAGMGLKVAVSSAEDARFQEIPRPVNEEGPLQLILLRAVRDLKQDAIGFVLVLRNTSDKDLTIDPKTFAARCGDGLYQARAIDSPAQLHPGEIKTGYFVIVGAGDGRSGWLEATNDWRISVSLVAPQMIPGEQIVKETNALKKATP